MRAKPSADFGTARAMTEIVVITKDVVTKRITSLRAKPLLLTTPPLLFISFNLARGANPFR
jgi:hypothetical protein